MYISRGKCEVVLAVAKLTTRLLGCSGWLLVGCQGILGSCYAVAMQLLGYYGWLPRCSGWLLRCC